MERLPEVVREFSDWFMGWVMSCVEKSHVFMDIIEEREISESNIGLVSGCAVMSQLGDLE